MRLPLACLLVVVAACSSRPAVTAPAAAPSLALYAGSHEVVVPGGPTLTLVAVDAGGARLDGEHDGEAFEVQDLSGADGARFGLLLVGDAVVVLRAASFDGDQPRVLEAWCLQWDAAADELVEMAVFTGR